MIFGSAISRVILVSLEKDEEFLFIHCLFFCLKFAEHEAVNKSSKMNVCIRAVIHLFCILNGLSIRGK